MAEKKDEPEKTADEKAFEAETRSFHKGGFAAADEGLMIVDDKPGAKAAGEDEPEKKGKADVEEDETGKRPAEKKAPGADDAEAEAEGDGDPDVVEVEEEPEPTGITARIKRAERKGAREATAEAEGVLTAKDQEIADLKAKLAAKELPAKPKLDDYDTTEEWEEAFGAWTIKKHEAETAAKTPAKTEKKDEPAKADATLPNLPPGITPEDMYAALADLDANLPPTVAARIKDEKMVPIFTAAVMIEIADETDNARKTTMARFVVGHPKAMAAIAKLPPRSQAAAFVRAVAEDTPKQPKKQSDAVPPGTRVNGAGASGLITNLSKASYREFEKMADEIDKKEGRRTY